MFVLVYMQNGPSFWRTNGSRLRENFENLLVKQVAKLLKKNKQSFGYFIAISKKYLLSYLQLHFEVKYVKKTSFLITALLLYYFQNLLMMSGLQVRKPETRKR